jgi:hypothetical protein
MGIEYGPTWPLDVPHRFVAVDTDDQFCAQCPGFLQELNVARMQNIEASVCENDHLQKGRSVASKRYFFLSEKRD